MSRLFAWAVALTVIVAPAALAQRPDGVQSTLLYKGKDAFVHAVPLAPGFVMTFTVPSTGVMKPILKTEPQPPPDGKRPAMHGALFGRSRLIPADLVAGVAVDDARLYVLTATRVYQAADADRGDGPRGRGGPGAGSADATARPPKLIGHRFKLHAFSLADGKPLMGDGYDLPLVSEDPKATEPPDTTRVTETLGRGPIELIKDGLKCLGTTVIFEGNSVKSLDVKGKQFTPPPGFFARDPDVRIG